MHKEYQVTLEVAGVQSIIALSRVEARRIAEYLFPENQVIKTSE